MLFKGFILIGVTFFARTCTLFDGQSSQKPKPSLTKCYRFNTNACCVSAHDNQIQNEYSQILSSQCQREYDNLEDYFCFGCNPNGANYIDPINLIVYICKSYAESLWGGNILLPTNQFDNCGFTTYWRSDDSGQIITPSDEWENAFQFFWEVKPPFFSDYYIVITDNSPNCYSNSMIMMIVTIFFII